jgi:hypothetical protein
LLAESTSKETGFLIEDGRIDGWVCGEGKAMDGEGIVE